MGVRSTKWGFLSFCQAINKSLCALLLYLSYNEVGWLTVRGLGAWPGACINSTTSVTSPLFLSLSLSLSPPLPFSVSFFRLVPFLDGVLIALLILFQPSFPTPQHPPPPPSLYPTRPRFLSASSCLDSSTLSAYESTQPRIRRVRKERVRRSAILPSSREGLDVFVVFVVAGAGPAF